MNGNVFGMQIVPDQMQVVNPAMVLILIPLFDNVFNPYFTRTQIMENSLHRMAIGGVFASAAFLAAGVLELVLETTYPKQPSKKQASINIINTLPCQIFLTGDLFEGVQNISLGGFYKFENLACDNFTTYKLKVATEKGCAVGTTGRARVLEAIAVEHQVCVKSVFFLTFFSLSSVANAETIYNC